MARKLLSLAILTAALAVLAWSGREVAVDLASERDLHGAGFAGSGACRRCHPSHYQSWARTYHRTMTQEASPESVLGNFDGARLRYGGVDAELARTEGGGFEMRFWAMGRSMGRARVVRTVGSHRYQQYLAQDGDVLFRLPLAWHVEERRWIHMNGAFLTPDPVPIAGVIAREDYHRHVTRWNDNCVFCHNVGPNPGVSGEPPGTERFQTRVAELGVACEACHGPGAEHARANGNPLRRYALHAGGQADPSIVNPERLSPA
ncbi:MAG: cytochrome c family protein, partial [Sandaracinaceae bacterium]|nr:cytochrome c family protein [Sandaracinaceae bacterium]